MVFQFLRQNAEKAPVAWSPFVDAQSDSTEAGKLLIAIDFLAVGNHVEDKIVA